MIEQENQNKKIIQLFKILKDNFLDKTGLLEILDIKSTTLAQYLSVIKAAGFDVIKRQKKYSIKTFDNKIEYDELDISMLSHIAVLGDLFLPKIKSKELKEIINDFIHKGSFENSKQYNKKYKLFKLIKQKKQNSSKIEMFQKALDKNLNLKIILNNSLKEHTYKPINFKWAQDKTILVFLDIKENKIKELSSEKIIKMSYMPQENYIKQNTDIIFELYGKLSKRYSLKENETILEKEDNKIVILNSGKNPEELYRRLLRYDNLCKITYPKEAKEKFKEILKKSLDNIMELNHN